MSSHTHSYGINVAILETLIKKPTPTRVEGGELTTIFFEPLFRLHRLDTDSVVRFETDEFETTVWLEMGSATVNNVPLVEHEALTIPPRHSWNIVADSRATFYLFSGQATHSETSPQKSSSFDRRAKYWGTIESVVSKSYAGKRIVKDKGAHASLEYHCRKLEGYYVHSGKLLLRLRAGRAEDRYLTLEPGMAVLIPPGLMHQRGGLENTVLMEISTHDEDSDSFLVEDGQKLPMPRLSRPPLKRSKRICFDIDGVIRTQTDGHYERAQPIREAITVVNKLHDEGYWITLYTSSFMRRNENDQHQAYADGYEFNRLQLASWNVKYDELFMGKPPTDILVDDRALFFRGDWQLIEQEIRRKLS